MRPQTLFEVLSGQQLTAVLAVERWGAELAQSDEQAGWPLYGALGLMFETHALLLTSPLRSSRSQHGTRIGLADGSSVALGLSATLCETEQAAAMVSFRLGMPPAEDLHWWAHQDLAVLRHQQEVADYLVGFVLQGIEESRHLVGLYEAVTRAFWKLLDATAWVVSVKQAPLDGLAEH